jgi:hypothetical protein
MGLKIEIDGWMTPYEYRALGSFFYDLEKGALADRAERGFGKDTLGVDVEQKEPGPSEADDVHVECGTGTGPLTAYPGGLPEDNPAPKRERGQPSAGRKRRTKEEIAEDEAADAADTQIVKPAISTGEERADPANPEPEVEDDPQDAIDEAEEVEAARDPVKPLTHDDVRAQVRDYVTKYGVAMVQKDGPSIFAAALGAPPEGKPGWMVFDIPDDQAMLAATVKAWTEAVANNPFGREVVAK